MNAPNSRLYYKATSSSRKGCDSGGMQQVVQNNTLCSNNGRNISRRIGEVVQEQCVEVTQVTRECGIR